MYRIYYKIIIGSIVTKSYEDYSESNEHFRKNIKYKKTFVLYTSKRTTKILLFYIVTKQIEALIVAVDKL